MNAELVSILFFHFQSHFNS